ncbi:MAG: 30S ribosomal protein S9 [bacterium]|nr:30S ribosomal protein S9 [bacterium]
MKEAEKQKLSYYEGIGRRKTAVARVRLYVGGDKGGITINDLPLNKHFSGKITEKIFLSPLEVTGNVGRFDIRIHVSGSGRTGQLGAIVHGLARALEKVDREKFRPLLKKQGFLTRDPRAKERRKVGKASNARKGKQSPKR